MRVLLLANGDPPSAEFAQACAARHDLLIATDGAAHRAAALGLTPAVICGDFDSADLAVAHSEFPDAEFIEMVDQDFADLEKALLLARSRGATEATIIGAGGGRIDHALTTIALLMRYHNEVGLTFEHDGSAVRAVSGTLEHPGALELATHPGDTLSLIAFTPSNLVSVSGVAWPLKDSVLPVGTHGVSNLATGRAVLVEVREGAVLVCHLYGQPKG